MRYDIQDITVRLDQVVEKYLHKEGERFVEKDGFMRRAVWPEINEGKYYKWSVFAEVPPDYKSTHGVTFEYWTVQIEEVKAGFYIGDYYTLNLDDAVSHFETNVSALKKKSQR